jgi:hypothetical protein
MPLSSKAKAGGSVRIHSSLLEECSKESRVQQSGWYTIIYEDWIRSLSFEDNKENILDPYRYIYPWLEYKVYDLISDTSFIGYLLSKWDIEKALESIEYLTLSRYATILEDKLFHIDECFRTFRKIGTSPKSGISDELTSILAFYEDAAKDAQGLIQIIIRRMQQRLTELSIQESQRSIREATSVKRLTQLAFVFIPLSFATSIFGMNLNELTGVGPNVWIFVITALVLLAPILLTWSFMVVKGKNEQRWVSMKTSTKKWWVYNYWRFYHRIFSGWKFWVKRQ